MAEAIVAVQADISQGLALAVVALIAVLPEYSVHMYFTWQAGQFPDSNYASYATANMTGANRLVIGVGWPIIVLIKWLKRRQPIRLGKERRTEIVLLAFATLRVADAQCLLAAVYWRGHHFSARAPQPMVRVAPDESPRRRLEGVWMGSGKWVS